MDYNCRIINSNKNTMEKESQEASHKRKEELLEGNEDKDFKIPPRKRSIIARILVIIAIAAIIAAVGIGAYLYQKPGSFLHSKVSNVSSDNTPKNETRSVNATTDVNVDSSAKGLIEDVNTATSVNANYQAVSPTTTFDPSAENIYVTIQTTNFTEAHQVKVEWYYVDTDTFIDDGSYAAQTGINNVAFHLEQPASGSWPEGDYQVKIYVDGKLAQIARFKVKGTLTGSDSIVPDNATAE